MAKSILNKVNFWEPIIGNQELKNIKKVLQINWPNEGSFTRLFEKKI